MNDESQRSLKLCEFFQSGKHHMLVSTVDFHTINGVRIPAAVEISLFVDFKVEDQIIFHFAWGNVHSDSASIKPDSSPSPLEFSKGSKEVGKDLIAPRGCDAGTANGI